MPDLVEGNKSARRLRVWQTIYWNLSFGLLVPAALDTLRGHRFRLSTAVMVTLTSCPRRCPTSQYARVARGLWSGESNVLCGVAG